MGADSELQLDQQREFAHAQLALERPPLEGVHLGEGDPVAQRQELGVGARRADRVDQLEVRASEHTGTQGLGA